MDELNYYEVLGLDQGASSKDIKKAYKKMVMMYHPDKVTSLGPKLQEVANEEMKKINLAKEILLDASKKEGYDRKLRDKEKGGKKKGGPAHKRDKQVMELNETLGEAEGLIDKMRTINGDVVEAENFFIQAKYAINVGDIAKALELARHSRDEARSTLYKYAVNVLLLSKKKLMKLKEQGFDVKSAFDRFVQARTPMAKEKFIEAADIASDAVRMANVNAHPPSPPDEPAEVEEEIPPPPRIVDERGGAEEGMEGDTDFQTPSQDIPKGYVAEWNEDSQQKDLEMYRSFLEDIWADGVITPEEQGELVRLKEKLGIGKEEHKELELEVKRQRHKNIRIYLEALEKTLEDGVIDDEERNQLYSLRKDLKLSKDQEFSI